ncbi:hypothetical protein COT99_04450 [Candidatus Falkowbacteria bacterium CG10_big_fil_rev_8_21_14_0_10_43_10]|uniref:DUF2283 domain-containing protein n=1 Tax=Candidatus Falkowbacteria bacterium CG10_big_fil_rev_8_21_14_0_10_43_10 TaxID=1974567 RepID=A0A2H0V148_9BACT|nr:MAG: hypothetical protein COT99_04450 [Candidatus Falkowbacteria bacterium CG10_big_fil_rev_8_21_14_0_10_43_10]
MVNYDPETNLISIEIAQGRIDHVIELGNFLIHVNKKNAPLLIEILDGGKFIGQLQKFKKEDIIKSVAPAG